MEIESIGHKGLRRFFEIGHAKGCGCKGILAQVCNDFVIGFGIEGVADRRQRGWEAFLKAGIASTFCAW